MPDRKYTLTKARSLCWYCNLAEADLLRSASPVCNINKLPQCQSESGQHRCVYWVLPVRSGWMTPFWSLHDSIFAILAFREFGTATPFTDIFRRSFAVAKCLACSDPGRCRHASRWRHETPTTGVGTAIWRTTNQTKPIFNLISGSHIHRFRGQFAKSHGCRNGAVTILQAPWRSFLAVDL